MSHRLVSVVIAMALLFGAMAIMSATEDVRVGAEVAVGTEGEAGDNTTAGNDTYDDGDPAEGNETADGDDDIGVEDDKADGDDTSENYTDGDDDTSGEHTDGDDDHADGLEGEWKATDEDGDKWTFKFTDDEFTIVTPDGTYKGTYTVDETQNPPTIDLTITDAPEGDEQYEGKVSKGIYDISGGDLSIAWGEPGTDRPASFDEEGALSLEASYVTPPEDDDDDDDESTPGFGAMLLLGAMGALAVAMLFVGRRR